MLDSLAHFLILMQHQTLLLLQEWVPPVGNGVWGPQRGCWRVLHLTNQSALESL